MKDFALIGAAGYIAERHMRAIKETGNNLAAALDPFDSVGIIDSYFPDADFFTEYERFDRHIDKLRRKNRKIDYVSICSPNYLHDAHIRFGLKQNADVISEKPMVLNPWNVDALEEIEAETGRRINNILQLRLHPNIIKLKQEVDSTPADKLYDIDLTYITSRGNWYFASWKSVLEKSGGVATNIGIHFFDMLSFIFGSVRENIVHISEDKKAGGYLGLEKARVRWFLSLDADDIPQDIRAQGQRTYRSVSISGKEIDFSGGFTDLHTQSYQQILKGNGFGISEVRPAIQTVYEIRNAAPVGLKGDYHPLLTS
jgi:UDP-N-acetyl-2-amino-2-deoxyglucuronate dehydrogenase